MMKALTVNGAQRPDHIDPVNWAVLALRERNPGLTMRELAALCEAEGLRRGNGKPLSRIAIIGLLSRNARYLPPHLRPNAKPTTKPALRADVKNFSKRCQWPIGHPGKPGFHFCGDENVVPGKPYCAAHCRIAYRAETKAKKSQPRMVLRLAGRD